jgi:hypothetical protein
MYHEANIFHVIIKLFVMTIAHFTTRLQLFAAIIFIASCFCLVLLGRLAGAFTPKSEKRKKRSNTAGECDEPTNKTHFICPLSVDLVSSSMRKIFMLISAFNGFSKSEFVFGSRRDIVRPPECD